MPRTPVCRPRLLPLLLAGVLAGALALPLRAQPAPGPAPLPAAVEVHLGVTELVGVTTVLVGVQGTLGVGDRVRIGAGAWGALERVHESPELELRGLDLGLGYGGAVIEYGSGRLPASIRLLVGGGAATLRTATVGTPFDTEAFVVVEPALRLQTSLFGPLSLGAEVAYRRTHAVDSRFLIDRHGLDGFSGVVVVRVGH